MILRQMQVKQRMQQEKTPQPAQDKSISFNELQQMILKWKKTHDKELGNKILQRLKPIITNAVIRNAGNPDPVLMSRARVLVLKSLKNYDPSKGQINTYVFNVLQGIKRYRFQFISGVHIPESARLQKQQLEQIELEMEEQLGRPPTLDELADKTGWSKKRIQHLQQLSESLSASTLDTFMETNPGGFQVQGPRRQEDVQGEIWKEIVYQDLDPKDKKIFEWTIGYKGSKKLPNEEIARRLKLTPGAISQRKKKIQQKLNELEFGL